MSKLRHPCLSGEPQFGTDKSDSGREDMAVDEFWERMGVPVRTPSDYML